MVINVLMSLVLTIIVELMISIVLGVNDKKDLLIIILVNMITNPIISIMNYCVKDLAIHYYLIVFVEIINIFIEGFIFKKYFKNKSINYILLSLINNISSYVLGIIINLNIGGVL